jgi:hypothetical protein
VFLESIYQQLRNALIRFLPSNIHDMSRTLTWINCNVIIIQQQNTRKSCKIAVSSAPLSLRPHTAVANFEITTECKIHTQAHKKTEQWGGLEERLTRCVLLLAYLQFVKSSRFQTSACGSDCADCSERKSHINTVPAYVLMLRSGCLRGHQSHATHCVLHWGQ